MKTFRQKGLNFEITVSKLLSSWINRELDDKDLHFWRTQGSGSVSTRLKVSKIDFFSGDITPLTEYSKKYLTNILIECKNTELDNNYLRNSFFPKQLDEYIDKLYSQVEENNKKYGFLFLKRNRGKIWLIILTKDDKISLDKISDNISIIKISSSSKNYQLFITDLNELIDKVQFSQFFLNFI